MCSGSANVWLLENWERKRHQVGQGIDGRANVLSGPFQAQVKRCQLCLKSGMACCVVWGSLCGCSSGGGAERFPAGYGDIDPIVTRGTREEKRKNAVQILLPVPLPVRKLQEDAVVQQEDLFKLA